MENYIEDIILWLETNKQPKMWNSENETFSMTFLMNLTE